MGRGIYIIVAASLAFGAMIMLTNRQTDLAAAANKGKYGNQVVAREIAKSGVSRGVSEARQALMDVVRQRSDVKVSEGEYDYTITDSGYGELHLKTTGFAGQAEHTIDTDLLFETPVESAVFLGADTVSVSTTGGFAIDGNDNRSLSSGGGKAYMKPVAAVQVPAGSVSKVQAGLPSASVKGVGGNNSIKPAVNKSDYVAILQDALANATTSLTAPVGGTYGTLSAPSVVHVDGDFKPTSDFSGAGVLVVQDGDFEPMGAFSWEGLVIVAQDATSSSNISLKTKTSLVGGLVAINSHSGTTTVSTPAPAVCDLEWDIVDKSVVPKDDFIVSAQVLGSELQRYQTDGMGGINWIYDLPVTSELHFGNETEQPWGDPTDMLGSSVGSTSLPFAPDKIYAAGTPTGLTANAFRMIVDDGTTTANPADWMLIDTQDSRNSPLGLEVLRHGATPPQDQGFLDQKELLDILGPHLAADGTVSLGSNQALFVFELGNADPYGPNSDWQDLVVLMNFGAAPNGAQGPADGTTSVTHVVEEIPVCPSKDESVPAPSEINFEIGGDSQITYSGEAIAKGGQALASIRERTVVVVAGEKESQK